MLDIALRASIKKMLENPSIFKDWTIQGFGMMRCYIPGPVYDKQFRLNIWDDRLAVPNVSVVHDHPWDFQSWIVNGAFDNQRYVEDQYSGDTWLYMTIKTGEGGGPAEKPKVLRIRPKPRERYSTGETYRQIASEIHCSIPDRGTVTLNERTRVGDGEHARVFWHAGLWVDAKPRKATPSEIYDTTRLALGQWQ